MSVANRFPYLDSLMMGYVNQDAAEMAGSAKYEAICKYYMGENDPEDIVKVLEDYKCYKDEHIKSLNASFKKDFSYGYAFVDVEKFFCAFKKTAKEHFSSLNITGDLEQALWNASSDVKAASAKVDADGWISWPGGKCPVAKGDLVDLKLRDGNEWESNDAPHFVGWRHDGGNSDIIAYRLCHPEKKTEPETVVWDGNGLPPVGCECEVAEPICNAGTRVRVLCHDEGAAVCRVLEGDKLHSLCQLEVREMRPLRTPEEHQRDEAVQALTGFFGHASGLYNLGGLYDAIAAGKIPGITLTAEKQSEGETLTNWIKCSYRMPQPFRAVLGFDPNWDKEAGIMHWNGGEYWQAGNEDYLTPTHWMPLPSPPEDV